MEFLGGIKWTCFMYFLYSLLPTLTRFVLLEEARVYAKRHLLPFMESVLLELNVLHEHLQRLSVLQLTRGEGIRELAQAMVTSNCCLCR